ncbi:MAG: hypothetical protein NZ520_06945, partial [bacterium]|nr:hypothetical protein [bacterium]
MTPDERIDAVWQSVRYTDAQMRRWVERLQAQVEFARQLAQANPSHQAEWEELILSAVQHFAQAIAEGKSVVEAVQQAEATLSPLSPVAKQYTIHCVGHAHIDMNW